MTQVEDIARMTEWLNAEAEVADWTHLGWEHQRTEWLTDAQGEEFAVEHFVAYTAGLYGIYALLSDSPEKDDQFEVVFSEDGLAHAIGDDLAHCVRKIERLEEEYD